MKRQQQSGKKLALDDFMNLVDNMVVCGDVVEEKLATFRSQKIMVERTETVRFHELNVGGHFMVHCARVIQNSQENKLHETMQYQ